MNQAITSQALSFCPVIPAADEPEGQIRDAEGNVWIQIKADHASDVSLIIYEQKFPFIKEEGIWKLKYPGKDGITLVQLQIDGMNVLTPYLPICYGYSRSYNYVSIETEEEFYYLKNVPHGTVRQEYFYSDITGEWERCFVYTPVEYEECPEKRYPVLYLQHGHGENETGWIEEGKVHFIMDNLIQAKEAKPFIIVMNNGMVQTKNAEGKRIVDHTIFPEYLIKDVIPYIEKKYRTIKNKDSRAMAGLSMGSIQTSITAFEYPEYFSYIGLFSGFLRDFIQGDKIMDMVQRGKASDKHLRILDSKETFKNNLKIFFRAMGENDIFIQKFLEEDELLSKKDISCIRIIYEGGMTGMYGDVVFEILRNCYSEKWIVM